MTLRELLERERDRAAEAAAESFWGPKEDLEDEERCSFDAEKSQHLAGFNRALRLLMPVVQAMEEIAEGRIDVQNWEIQKARDALQELKAKLGDK